MKRFRTPSPSGTVSAESIGDPAFVVDMDGTIVSWNDAAEIFFNQPASEVIGLKCPAVIRACLPTGEGVCSADCPLIQGVGVDPGPPAVELMVRTADRARRRRHATVQHIPLADSAGHPTGMLHIVLPVPEQPRERTGERRSGMVPGGFLG